MNLRPETQREMSDPPDMQRSSIGGRYARWTVHDGTNHPSARGSHGGQQAKEICRDQGITEQSYYRWKAKYGGPGISETRRLKQPEDTTSAPQAFGRRSGPQQPGTPENIVNDRIRFCVANVCRDYELDHKEYGSLAAPSPQRSATRCLCVSTRSWQAMRQTPDAPDLRKGCDDEARDRPHYLSRVKLKHHSTREIIFFIADPSSDTSFSYDATSSSVPIIAAYSRSDLSVLRLVEAPP
jgi:Transposase